MYNDSDQHAPLSQTDEMSVEEDHSQAKPDLAQRISANESAAHLNHFSRGAKLEKPFAFDSSTTGRARKSKLKRISQEHQGRYRGVNHSGGVQRRFASKPLISYDPNEDSDSASATLPGAARAPSVDVESMIWQVRDSARIMKKQKLDHARLKMPHSSRLESKNRPGITARVADSPHELEAPELAVRRKAGRPRKMQAEAVQTPADNAISHAPSGGIQPSAKRKRGRPKKILDQVEKGELPQDLEPHALDVVVHTEQAAGAHQIQSSARPAHDHESRIDGHTENMVDSQAGNVPISPQEQEPVSPEEADTGIRNISSSGEHDSDSSDLLDQSPAKSNKDDRMSETHARETGSDKPTDKAVDLLQRAYLATKGVGVKHEGKHSIRCPLPAVKSKSARNILKVCGELSALVAALEDREESSIRTLENNDDIDLLIGKLTAMTHDIVHIEGQVSKGVTEDVYVHVIPKLTDMMWKTLQYWQITRVAELSCEQAQTILTLMHAIVALGMRIRNVSNINPGFPIKNLINHQIVNKIKDASKYVANRIAAFEMEREAKIRAERRVELLRQREREETESAMKEQAIHEWKRHWGLLHSERLRAEQTGPFLRPSKLQHLRVIPLATFANTTFELDADGYPFERVQALTQRHKQPPLGDLGNSQIWPEDPSYDLLKGLREFAGEEWHLPMEYLIHKLKRLTGPNVYVKLYWKYCRPGQSLNPYNVTEIVDQAVWLRDQFIKVAEEAGEAPDDWIIGVRDPRIPPDMKKL